MALNPPYGDRVGVSRAVREHVVSVDGVDLSGLLAVPEGEPRGLVVALHGAGMHAAYHHAQAEPGMSLLDVGARVGFAVWAPDRPGYGVTADLPDERLAIHPQAELLQRSILDVAEQLGERLRVVVVAHSYGLKVGLVLAARPWEGRLAGIDGVGTGHRFRPDRQPVPGDIGPAWGPRRGYPSGTFAKGMLPLAPVPAVQTKENARWADDLTEAARTIRVPVQVTYGEHERFWPTDEEAFERFRGLFPVAPRVDVRVIPGVGHNVSLSVQARAYHLRCLAFAEECLVGASTIPPS